MTERSAKNEHREQSRSQRTAWRRWKNLDPENSRNPARYLRLKRVGRKEKEKAYGYVCPDRGSQESLFSTDRSLGARRERYGARSPPNQPPPPFPTTNVAHTERHTKRASSLLFSSSQRRIVAYTEAPYGVAQHGQFASSRSHRVPSCVPSRRHSWRIEMSATVKRA